MAILIFYEKPGCISNARQKRLLKDSGHLLKVRNLLAEPWTPDTLRPFFGTQPVEAWFNKTAPRVKSGEIVPQDLCADAALRLMCADPILIRRPLMETGGHRCAGFDPGQVHDWIGLTDPDAQVTENCPKGVAQTP